MLETVVIAERHADPAVPVPLLRILADLVADVPCNICGRVTAIPRLTPTDHASTSQLLNDRDLGATHVRTECTPQRFQLRTSRYNKHLRHEMIVRLEEFTRTLVTDVDRSLLLSPLLTTRPFIRTGNAQHGHPRS